MNTFIILGSGKGTQCEKMIEKYGFTHLSAGDLIRATAEDSSSEKGRYFNEAMSQGKLISSVMKSEIFKNNFHYFFLSTSRKIFLSYLKMLSMKKLINLQDF